MPMSTRRDHPMLKLQSDQLPYPRIFFQESWWNSYWRWDTMLNSMTNDQIKVHVYITSVLLLSNQPLQWHYTANSSITHLLKLLQNLIILTNWVQHQIHQYIKRHFCIHVRQTSIILLFTVVKLDVKHLYLPCFFWRLSLEFCSRLARW